jgi:hypothetical protein
MLDDLKEKLKGLPDMINPESFKDQDEFFKYFSKKA